MVFICLKEGKSSVQCFMHLKKASSQYSAVVSVRYSLLGRGFSILVPSIIFMNDDYSYIANSLHSSGNVLHSSNYQPHAIDNCQMHECSYCSLAQTHPHGIGLMFRLLVHDPRMENM